MQSDGEALLMIVLCPLDKQARIALWMVVTGEYLIVVQILDAAIVMVRH